MSRNFRAIDELLKEEGALVLGLLRLTFAPFGLTNYVAGVTSISAFNFLLGTCFYIFNSSMQIFIGCSLYGM